MIKNDHGLKAMSKHLESVLHDQTLMMAWLAENRVIPTVAEFQPGPGIQKLNLRFDLCKLREAVEEARQHVVEQGDGFSAIPITRRPGDRSVSDTDLIGRYYLRPDETYEEVARDEILDEFSFSEIFPQFKDTYFETVHTELTKRFPTGRMRVLLKAPLTCNSWHRDPEPRVHIPIITNPGSLFVVNHHVTHLPADGSVYFTDTRGYHTALNGGEQPRVHLVAALPQKI